MYYTTMALRMQQEQSCSYHFSRSLNTAMLCRERSSICRSPIFNSLLLPDCFSNNAIEKSGIPVEENIDKKTILVLQKSETVVSFR